ncbi:MAG: EAL domain-containing protein [Rhodoferax sp.]|nr:EAL domain-containing protein [Rhodoferax sp.]
MLFLRHLLSAPNSLPEAYPELIDAKHVPLLKLVIWGMLMGSLVFMVLLVNSRRGHMVPIFASIGLAILCAVALVMLRWRGVMPTAKLLVVGSWLLITLASFGGEGLNAPALLAYPLTLIFGGWMLGIGFCLRLFGASCIAVLAIGFKQQTGAAVGVTPVPPATMAFAYLFILAISAVVTVYLLRVFQDRHAHERRLNHEIKRNLRTVEERESDLRVLTEHIPGLVFEGDRNGRCTFANRGFVEFFGIPVEKLTHYSVSQIIGLDTAKEFTPFHEAVLRGATVEFSSRKESAQGVWHNFDVTLVPKQRMQGQEVSGWYGLMYDVTKREERVNELRERATHDPLTGLANRLLLEDRLAHAMERASRVDASVVVMAIDLDHFKAVNDMLGHAAGDKLLCEISGRLKSLVRSADTIARVGGDEFVMVMDGGVSAEAAELVATKILGELSRPVVLDAETVQIGGSIGIAIYPSAGLTSAELLRAADGAMYDAKAAGRDTLRFFDPKMQTELLRRSETEGELRQAILGRQFILHYQVQMQGDRPTGAEALVRWKHPQRGLVSPAQFIPLSEESGLILPLGWWVLDTACEQLALWADQPGMADLTLAVNVSARQFRQSDFVSHVLAAIERSGANPNRLKLELTESLLVSNMDEVIVKMGQLKQKGVGFSLDDFGTGYSSLIYLKRLPLDQLKIDQEFVRDILIDPNDAAIAKMIVALADSMGLSVMAEGVETELQRHSLELLGCSAFQGYLFGRPLPVEDFERLVQWYEASRLKPFAPVHPFQPRYGSSEAA